MIYYYVQTECTPSLDKCSKCTQMLSTWQKRHKHLSHSSQKPIADACVAMQVGKPWQVWTARQAQQHEQCSSCTSAPISMY